MQVEAFKILLEAVQYLEDLWVFKNGVFRPDLIGIDLMADVLKSLLKTI